MSGTDRWPVIRAGLIAIVLAINLLSALPKPHSITERSLQIPRVQTEVARWTAVLHGAGLDWTEAEVGQMTVRVTGQWIRWRRALFRPVSPFWRWTGTHQGWGLFAQANERPHALVIEGATKGQKFEPLYRSDDRGLRWSHSFVTYRRVRAAYKPAPTRQASFGPFVDEVARRAFDTFPELERVRVRLTTKTVTLPGEPRVEEKRAFGRVRRRSELQP